MTFFVDDPNIGLFLFFFLDFYLFPRYYFYIRKKYICKFIMENAIA